MSEVEDGKPLSQVVRTAKSLGYTEPGFSLREPFSCILEHCRDHYMNAKRYYLTNFISNCRST